MTIRLPNGSVPVADIKDVVVRDRLMKMNENIVYIEKVLQSLATAEKRKVV